MINHVFLITVIFNWALFFVSLLAVTACFFLVLFASEDLVVVAFDSPGNILTCAV